MFYFHLSQFENISLGKSSKNKYVSRRIVLMPYQGKARINGHAVCAYTACKCIGFHLGGIYPCFLYKNGHLLKIKMSKIIFACLMNIIRLSRWLCNVNPSRLRLAHSTHKINYQDALDQFIRYLTH